MTHNFSMKFMRQKCLENNIISAESFTLQHKCMCHSFVRFSKMIANEISQTIHGDKSNTRIHLNLLSTDGVTFRSFNRYSNGVVRSNNTHMPSIECVVQAAGFILKFKG